QRRTTGNCPKGSRCEGNTEFRTQKSEGWSSLVLNGGDGMTTGALLDKVADLDKAAREHLRSGQTILVAGFGRGGVPFSLLEYMADHPDDYRDLTLVKNDANEPAIGIGMLIEKGM